MTLSSGCLPLLLLCAGCLLLPVAPTSNLQNLFHSWWWWCGWHWASRALACRWRIRIWSTCAKPTALASEACHCYWRDGRIIIEHCLNMRAPFRFTRHAWSRDLMPLLFGWRSEVINQNGELSEHIIAARAHRWNVVVMRLRLSKWTVIAFHLQDMLQDVSWAR